MTGRREDEMTGEDGGGRRWLDRVYPDRKSLKREEGGREGGTDLALDLMITALLYLQRSKQWVVVTGSWKVRGRSQDKYLPFPLAFPLSDQIGRFGRHPPDRSVSSPSFPPLPPIAI